MITKEEVITSCESFCQKHGRLPRQKDFYNGMLPEVNQYMVEKYFGSMSNLHNAMDVITNIKRRKRLSLIASGRNFRKRSGSYPTRRDITAKNYFKYGDKTVVSLFGSWDNYLNAIGHDGHHTFTAKGQRRRRGMSVEQFKTWLKCQKIMNGECWIWSKNTNSSGYGLVLHDGRYQQVHRLSYELFVDKIPDGLIIRHQCSNRKCYNPNHLVVGTHSENRMDHLAKVEIGTLRNPPLIRKPEGLWGNALIEWALFNTTKNGDCLDYPSYRKYPMVYHNGKGYRLGRLVCSLKNKLPYTGDWIARHLCHNPSCINPDHITHGSRSKNAIDSRGYSLVSKLDMCTVLEIRKSWENSKTKPTLFDKQWAVILEVSPSTISSIRLNRTWLPCCH